MARKRREESKERTEQKLLVYERKTGENTEKTRNFGAKGYGSPLRDRGVGWRGMLRLNQEGGGRTAGEGGVKGCCRVEKMSGGVTSDLRKEFAQVRGKKTRDKLGEKEKKVKNPSWISYARTRN